MPIYKKSLDDPDATEEYIHGEAEAVQVEESIVWRSRLRPGWSWLKDVKPRNGMDFCPADHREYVVSGHIRYHMREGGFVEAGPGDHLVIEPGHQGEVIGDEECVLIDW